MMFELFKEVQTEEKIQESLKDIKHLFSTNQILLNCLQQLKRLNQEETNHQQKLSLVQSFSFNQLTTETLLSYSLETIDKLINEILQHQNQISLQHRAFLHLNEHLQIDAYRAKP